MTKAFISFVLFLLTFVATSTVADAADTSIASSSGSNQPLRPPRARRNLFCLGILRDCDEVEEDDTNSTDVGSGAGSTDIGTNDWCLGIFRDCDSNNNGNSETNQDCSESDTGVFGGRPLFGDCGIITEILFGIFNGTDTDGDGIDDKFNFGSNSSDKGPFGFGLLPEGGFLYKIFNRDDDKTVLEAIVDVFDEGTDAFVFGFIEDWSESAVPTNQTCVNADEAPACFDATGNDGFWVCRTLTDPFSAQPASKSVCIGEGSFLEGNDACGCCPSSTNSTSAPTCPDQCPCVCDREGTGDGVWTNTNLNILNVENATDLNIRNCVDPRWAVSATNGFERITCLQECPTDEEA